MTRLFNDPKDFADEALAGFVAANRATVAQVFGGVVRNDARDDGVALVIGGGSGHYPAFMGLVGPGIAHGAAVGNVFASPSTQQICSVARAADKGSGVLFAFGNYMGDVLNFTAAKDQLESEGIPCRIVAVTDDIASASADEAAKRRGVAGGLIVYKLAGRAADEGRSLEEVTRIAELANSRTRSLGIALSGCSLPGSDAPLFTLPEGRMSVGMGVHGEPGIAEQDEPTADELAEILVSRLLAELPDGVEAAGSSAAVVLNGLGSIKYEELFVVYRRVDELLGEAGVEVVEPEVGEFTTSFAMAGASLTLCWLTEELRDLWLAPADSPAFKRGEIRRQSGIGSVDSTHRVSDSIPEGSPDSQAAAEMILEALRASQAAIVTAADDLGRLDAVAGDGDHGIGMSRGIEAAVEAAEKAVAARSGAGGLLRLASDAWAAAAGGTSGMLWGVLLGTIGSGLGDEEKVTAELVSQAVSAAAAEVQRVGEARVGDKTMVDALVPFAESLRASVDRDASLRVSWIAAARVASAHAEATADLVARVGRARPLGSKSLGSPDPGAVSLALILQAVADMLGDVTQTDS